MLTTALSNQYHKCFDMLAETIDNYDEAIWFDDKDYKSPAWQIAYHAIFYTNIYCSPTESMIAHWSNEKTDYHDYKKMRELRKTDPSRIRAYTRNEMQDFLIFLKDHLQGYLEGMQPEEKCWPYWYNETQLEFHINNLRHIQHHIAEMIERHDISLEFRYRWK